MFEVHYIDGEEHNLDIRVKVGERIVLFGSQSKQLV